MYTHKFKLSFVNLIKDIIKMCDVNYNERGWNATVNMTTLAKEVPPAFL